MQILEQETKPLKAKLLNIAATIRNNAGVEQCTGLFIKGEKMCVMGLLGFRAGIPKEDLEHQPFLPVWKAYGIDYDTDNRVIMPARIAKRGRPTNIAFPLTRLYGYNDAGLSFDEIADVVEEKANSL